MSDQLTNLFAAFDRGLISRRQLLQALGIAAVVRPVSALAQGQPQTPPQGGQRGAADTTPAPPPFEPTGWKTVLLDRFTVQVADYEKEAAYYAALMNWKVRSDDGKKAVLDIGDWGAIEIRGGYQPPPPPPAPPAANPPAAGAANANPGAGRGGGNQRPPNLSHFDSFCWGIEPWDAKKVEAELKKRGLNPIADNEGKDFQSFRVKDPGGFDLQISNGNMKNRRGKPANGKLGAAAPFESTNWKTMWLDHISFQCPDYKASVAFYAALLGWTPGNDTGSQNECQIGDVGGVIIRRGGGGGGRRGAAAGADAAAAPPPPPQPTAPRMAQIDHISFGIAPWDPDKVREELEKRGLAARVDTGGGGDIHTSQFQSYHTYTTNGFDLQISNVTSRTRTVR